MSFPTSYKGAPSPVLPAMSFAALASTDPAAPPPIHGPAGLDGDLLMGAEEIAVYLFGAAKAKRQVYRLTSEVPPQHRLPVFRLSGNTLCARKSTILAWIAAKEAQRAVEMTGLMDV
jgi:hypothetical protein